MSKMKTNKGAAKRFKKTAKGFKRKLGNLRHILTKRSTNQKRGLRKKAQVPACQKKAVSKMLGEA